jgi:1-deoxy-D-xylulose-5-phosphate reductoisomerase
MSEKKKVAILGSTGSIGTQALEVIKSHPDKFEVEVLTAQNNADLLIQQALQFQPNAVVIANELLYLKVKDALNSHDIKVFAGERALAQVVEMKLGGTANFQVFNILNEEYQVMRQRPMPGRNYQLNINLNIL